MAALGSAVTTRSMGMLTEPAGLPARIAALVAEERIDLATIPANQVIAQQVAFETAEKTAGVLYPAVYVYCEGITNTLKEKFRTFSGRAQMVIEVRTTHDHLEKVSSSLQYYAGAVAEVLERNRGCWEEGMFYTGGYKVEFGPIKHGGKHFIQTAKVKYEVEVSY